MRIAVITLLVVSHWVAFMVGRADVKQNTVVADIWGGGPPQSGIISKSYFGKCDISGRLCAIDEGDKKSRWIPRGL